MSTERRSITSSPRMISSAAFRSPDSSASVPRGKDLDHHGRDDHDVVTHLIQLVMKSLPLFDHDAILTSSVNRSGQPEATGR